MGLCAVSLLRLAALECVSGVGASIFEHDRWACESCEASCLSARNLAHLIIVCGGREPDVGIVGVGPASDLLLNGQRECVAQGVCRSRRGTLVEPSEFEDQDVAHGYGAATAETQSAVTRSAVVVVITLDKLGRNGRERYRRLDPRRKEAHSDRGRRRGTEPGLVLAASLSRVCGVASARAR